MHPRTRNAREHWTAVTEPTLPALIGAAISIVLVPVLITYLAGHLVLGGGLLLGIGLSAFLARLRSREADYHQQSNHGQTAEVPVWFDLLGGKDRAPVQSTSS